LKEGGRGLFEVLSWHLLKETGENQDTSHSE